MTKAALDVSVLFEDVWTGIPNVAAAIAKAALQDTSINWEFMYETIFLNKDFIAKLLSNHSGAGSLPRLADVAWNSRAIDSRTASNIVALFPNIKPVRSFFGRELMIVHDLSPLLTPQFHHPDNIAHFACRIRGDIETSDHVFCDSFATLNDVVYYLGKSASSTSVIKLGAAFDDFELSAGLLSVRNNINVEPYVAVIGTLEPRKNGSLILDYLIKNPDFAERYRFVFIGRDGWLDEKSRLLKRLLDVGIRPERINFTGHISNFERTALIQNAQFCVYPSFFEGFGLPVLEAGSLGKVTACSNSSSMPEVMPEQCVFFDPTDLFDFGRAMKTAEKRSKQSRSSSQSLSDLVSRSSQHGWDECYKEISRVVRG